MRLATISLTSIAALALFAATSQAAPRTEAANLSLDQLTPRAARSVAVLDSEAVQLADHRRHYRYHRGHGHHHGRYHHGHYPSYRSHYYRYHSPRYHNYYRGSRYHSYHGHRGGFGIHGRNFSLHFGF